MNKVRIHTDISKKFRDKNQSENDKNYDIPIYVTSKRNRDYSK